MGKIGLISRKTGMGKKTKDKIKKYEDKQEPQQEKKPTTTPDKPAPKSSSVENRRKQREATKEAVRPTMIKAAREGKAQRENGKWGTGSKKRRRQRG